MAKTAIDSAAAGAGATALLLNGTQDFADIDLWAITLNGGVVIRWHNGPFNIPITFTHFGSQSSAADGTYLAGPPINRDKITTKSGTEVATLDATFFASLTDLINGFPLIPFLRGNGLDGATVTLWKGFIPTLGVGQAITGVINNFSGRVTELKDVSRSQATVTISSWMVLLNVNMGPDVYQPGCLNTHYDSSCTLTPSNVAGAATAGGTTTSFGISGAAAGEPDHFFDKGTITFTSGANTGEARAVQSNVGGVVTVAFPFPNAPANGDTFNAVRGCLLTMADCTAQSNLIHFRGQPFIPAAVNAITGLPT